MNVNAALYIRVSTEEQTEFSPDAQKRYLLDYAKKNNMTVEDENIFIDEGISGTSAKKRLAFQRMISIAKKKPKPFDAILVHKYDRFSRSREDSVVYKTLLRKECGIKVISITEHIEDDKFSVILEAMLEAMAEYYSLNLSDEVMKGMSEKAIRGEVQANAPYGYKTEGGKYIPVPDEVDVVKMIFSKIANKEWGYGDTCRNLLSMSIMTRNGNPWTVKRLKYMLQNPIYIGKVRWNYSTHKGGRRINTPDKWIITNGSHTPIIDIDTFNIVNNTIEENKIHSTRPHSSKIKHWLSGLLRCSSCNGTLILASRQYNTVKKGDYINKYYRCNQYNKGACDTTNHISLEVIEKDVKDELRKWIVDSKDTYVQPHIEIINNNEKEILEKNLEKVKRKYLIAKNAYLSEVDSLEEYKANKDLILKEEVLILEKLDLLKISSDTHITIKNLAIEFLDIVDNPEVSIKNKNNLLKSFISKIVINVANDTFDIHCFVKE